MPDVGHARRPGTAKLMALGGRWNTQLRSDLAQGPGRTGGLRAQRPRRHRNESQPVRLSLTGDLSPRQAQTTPSRSIAPRNDLPTRSFVDHAATSPSVDSAASTMNLSDE
jgi:hypothetical protein